MCSGLLLTPGLHKFTILLRGIWESLPKGSAQHPTFSLSSRPQMAGVSDFFILRPVVTPVGCPWWAPQPPRLGSWQDHQGRPPFL